MYIFQIIVYGSVVNIFRIATGVQKSPEFILSVLQVTKS